MRFVYRRSPIRMAPRETVQVANNIFIFQGGRVTFRDPALENRGDAIVVLDHHRGLVNFLAFPSGRAPAADWKPLLASTGIEMSSLSAHDAGAIYFSIRDTSESDIGITDQNHYVAWLKGSATFL